MEPIFSTIPSVVYGLDAGSAATPALAFAAWKNIAGELLNERAAVTKLEDSHLTVAVEDETWQRHLEGLAPQMLARLNGALRRGEVKRIEFVVDADAVAASKAKIKQRTTTIVDVPASIENAAKAISDEALRHNFIAAAGAYLAKAKDQKPKTEDR
ncbi:MAG: DUF721 domain-containing protein [Blastocatellia bacterium]|nr:DUF721 domain-containing protein [Blastocatellia bacterium]